MIRGNLSFDFQPIVAGQRKASATSEPQLILASTVGKFTLTQSVVEAMGLKTGDYVQFADNITAIMTAIRNQNEDLVAICNANGISLDTEEGVAAVVKEFLTFGIFKGVSLKNSDGTDKLAAIRTTKEEKLAYANAHRAEIEAALMQAGIEVNDDNILASITSRKEPAFSGSKLYNSSGLSGTGVTISFSDTYMWNKLKEDLDPDVRKTIRRIYTVDVKNPTTKDFFNGYENVPIQVFSLKEHTDENGTRYVAE